MVGIIKSFLRWLRSFVRPHAPEIDAVPCQLEELHATPQKELPRTKMSRGREELGPFYYMSGLLDNLDNFFADYDFLRRNDPEMATVFSNLGCAISNDRQLFSSDIQPAFTRQLPSVGCVYMGRGGDGKERINCRFLYFQKLYQPINVQPTNGTTYSITAVYDDKRLKISKYHIAVFPDGTARVLKEGHVKTYTVGKSRSKKSTFHRFEWSYPWVASALQENWNEDRSDKLTIHEAATNMAAILFNYAANSELGVNVRVKKSGRTATFSIDMLRTPYFFADRQKTVNVNGKTEKILHFVRPHTRTSRSGVTKTIKGHWRGVRQFVWNGYDVSIGMPGKHIMPLMLTLNMAGYDEVDIERLGEKGVPMEEVSRIVSDNLELERAA